MCDIPNISEDSSFRLNCFNLAFTYPKCPASPEFMLESLMMLFSAKKPLYVRVSQEHHLDGSAHLHCLVCLDGKVDIKNARYADVMYSNTVYHPNFKKAWDPAGWRDYIMKEGWNTAVFGAFENVRLPKKGNQSEKIAMRVARKINDGKSVRDMLLKPRYQPYMLTNLAKAKFFETQLMGLKMAMLQPWPQTLTPLTGQNWAILKWIALNLPSDTPARPLRTKNLYLESPPGMGKTSLALLLSKTVKTYFPSLGEKYYDGLTNDHQLIVFDEFCGGHPLSLMNQILDGQECILPQRYQCLNKTRNIPVLILSNIAPHDCYKKAHPRRVEAFVDRLEHVVVNHFISIFKN